MLKNVQCVYPTLSDASAYKEGDKKKYSITLLIPKDDKEQLPAFTKWIKDCVAGTTWKKETKTHVTKTALDYEKGFNKYCILKDGDIINEKRVEDEKGSKDFNQGVIVIKPSKDEDRGRPVVVDQKKNVISVAEIAGKITSGDYVNVQVYGSCYDFQGSKGFAVKLNAVQKVKDGEDLTAHNPFEELEIEEVEEGVGTEEGSNPFA